MDIKGRKETWNTARKMGNWVLFQDFRNVMNFSMMEGTGAHFLQQLYV